jgi:Domain of unknown function (DUF3854)
MSAVQPEQMEEASSPDLILEISVKKLDFKLLQSERQMGPMTDADIVSRSEYSLEESFLNQSHLRLLQESAVSAEVRRARGYQTITTRSALKGYGFSLNQCRPPALLIPIFDPRGRLVSYQIRPDQPRIDCQAGALNYEICPGRQSAIDVPPPSSGLLSDPGVPLYVTDEVIKADSAASHGLCCIALVSSSWLSDEHQGSYLNSDEWESIALDGRTVRLIYDADSTDRAPMQDAFMHLRKFFWSRNARVQRINL